MTKMRQEKWHDRPRMERLANVLYAHLAPPEVQREMLETAEVEGKRASLEQRIARDKARVEGYKPKVASRVLTPGKYDNVPGLRRK
jgi:hypothetical protein